MRLQDSSVKEKKKQRERKTGITAKKTRLWDPAWHSPKVFEIHGYLKTICDLYSNSTYPQRKKEIQLYLVVLQGKFCLKLSWTYLLNEKYQTIACSCCQPDMPRKCIEKAWLGMNSEVGTLFSLPNLATCVPTFEQPSRWTNFFGSRLRTYFVPFQTGNHYFFLCKMLFLTW